MVAFPVAPFTGLLFWSLIEQSKLTLCPTSGWVLVIEQLSFKPVIGLGSGCIGSVGVTGFGVSGLGSTFGISVFVALVFLLV